MLLAGDIFGNSLKMYTHRKVFKINLSFIINNKKLAPKILPGFSVQRYILKNPFRRLQRSKLNLLLETFCFTIQNFLKGYLQKKILIKLDFVLFELKPKKLFSERVSTEINFKRFFVFARIVYFFSNQYSLITSPISRVPVYFFNNAIHGL